MDLPQAITTRFSARLFDNDRHVSRADLEAIAGAGAQAPSSKDAQPWCLHVVQSSKLLRHLATAMLAAPGLESYAPIDPATGSKHTAFASSVQESARVLGEVPAAVFVENLGSFSRGRRELLAHPERLAESLVGYCFEIIGIGAAVENMWLTAHDRGLGAVFLGDVLIIEDAVQRLLGMEGDLVGALAVGYSTPPRYAPKMLLGDRVKYYDH